MLAATDLPVRFCASCQSPTAAVPLVSFPVARRGLETYLQAFVLK
jgi:hypothetical protein